MTQKAHSGAGEPARAAAETITAAQAEADTRHWLEAAVIGLNLCPFAKAVHVKRQVHYAVHLPADDDAGLLDRLLAEADALGGLDSSERDTTLLMAPNTLAEEAGVTRATVTGLLDGLEREQLVERHADAYDRRALRIRLTRKGKRVTKAVFEQHSRWIASLYGNLTLPERKQLAALLEKVSASVGLAKS